MTSHNQEPEVVSLVQMAARSSMGVSVRATLLDSTSRAGLAEVLVLLLQLDHLDLTPNAQPLELL